MLLKAYHIESHEVVSIWCLLNTTQHCCSTNINSIRYVEIYIYVCVCVCVYLEIILFNLLNLLNIKCRRWCYPFLLTGQNKHIPRTDHFLKVVTFFFLPSTSICSFSALWTGLLCPLVLVWSTPPRLGSAFRPHYEETCNSCHRVSPHQRDNLHAWFCGNQSFISRILRTSHHFNLSSIETWKYRIKRGSFFGTVLEQGLNPWWF